jgi:peptide/nickel transport system permease protein
VPPFLTGLLLILLFGIAFPILPVSGEVSIFEDPGLGIQYLLLPSIALALPQAAVIARLLKTNMIQVRSEDFVDLATAKGASPFRITRRHVLRNSLGSAVVVIGLRIGELLAGAIVVESIFARNGLGSLAVSSVQTRDYQVVQVLIVGAVFIAVVIQLLSEVALAALDPRIRLES